GIGGSPFSFPWGNQCIVVVNHILHGRIADYTKKPAIHTKISVRALYFFLLSLGRTRTCVPRSTRALPRLRSPLEATTRRFIGSRIAPRLELYRWKKVAKN